MGNAVDSANKVNSGPPQEYNLSLEDGLVAISGYACTYTKNAFGRVYVNYGIQSDSYPSPIVESLIIANLPKGFRPARSIGGSGTGTVGDGSGGQAYATRVTAHTDGRISLMVSGSSVSRLYGEISFQAAK